MHKRSPRCDLATGGSNIWAHNANTILKYFKESYIFEYAALPSNTQFMERGVKESGYVALGKMLKRYNMVQVRGEIAASELSEKIDDKWIGKDSSTY